jgi:hypothetical protein
MPKINRDGVDIYYEVHGSGPALFHAVNIDQPQAFIEAVLPFLDSLEARTAQKAAS